MPQARPGRCDQLAPFSAFIAVDHQITRSGVRALLEESFQARIVGEAERGSRALRALRRANPDLLVLNLSLPYIGGLEVLRRLGRGGALARALVLTRRSDGPDVKRAFERGASGYVLKSDPPEQIVRAIRSVMAGERFLSPQLPQHFAEEGGSTPQSARQVGDPV